MGVATSEQHLSLNRRLAQESNRLVKRFSNKSYSKIEKIHKLLPRRDISVERKKELLAKKLHNAVVAAFSIDKGKFNKSSLEALKRRISAIREMTGRLRGINYYIETSLLDDLNVPIKKKGSAGLRLQGSLARDEIEALEYAAYKLIEGAAMLDKRLLDKYSRKKSIILKKQKMKTKDLEFVLGKESAALEHLEAKLPPPRAIGMALLKEPAFTHWAARVFALLSYFEHMHHKERGILSGLKKRKSAKRAINRKIAHLIREKSELLGLMQEKAASMEKLRLDGAAKRELHKFTAAIRL
ncbi:hypothetical protein HYT53_01595 [Candidatus Woesearchaeota archaeon]|nr:hypothetical protein [Candidatus Woesearchaeota archaeon]